MITSLFLLLMSFAHAQKDVMFCTPVKGGHQPDLIWVETQVVGAEATYKGLIRASHRSFGIRVDEITQIEWVFKDITVPTPSHQNTSSYRLIFRETGWTLDEYSEEYQKTFQLDCQHSQQ